MADKGIDSRLKLTITEVKDRQPVGDKGAVKLTFMATEGESDKALSYFTFSTRLFETIEQGKEIDCDVNISTRNWERDGDIQTFTDRKVTQIYIDGQPVGGQRRQGGYGYSPEKLASIEAQSRAKIISELWIAGVIDKDSAEVKNLRTWLLGGGIKAEIKKPETKTQAPKQEPVEDIFPDEESQGKTVQGNLVDLPIKNLGDLFNACLHHLKMNQSDVLKELGGITKDQISDAREAWLQIIEAKGVQ